MAQVEPSGLLSEPLGKVRDLLINLSAFRTWAGVATAELAKPHISFFGVKSPNVPWPHVVIGFEDPLVDGGENPRWEAVSISSGVDYRSSGIVYATFAARVAAEHKSDPGDALMTFSNGLGPILEAMQATARTNEYLYMNRWSLRMGPVRNDVVDGTSLGDSVTGVVRIHWGLGS